MKVFVIGGAGYIGSHVVRALLDRGDQVTVFDNLVTGMQENLFDEAAFVRGDILDEAALRTAMGGGFDACIHLAAFKAAGESMLVPEKYSRNNISGTVNILNAMLACGIPRIVFSSTAAVYGAPRYLPMDEDHPTVPENFYGYTKLAIEGLLGWYEKLRGLRFGVLRYFNAAGYDRMDRIKGLERNPANLLPVIMEVAAGKRPHIEIFGTDYDTIDGSGVRDYIHVSDLAAGHCSALDHITTHDSSLLVNLGTSQGLSVLQMVEAARRITGRPIPAVTAPRRAGDPSTVVAGAGRARQILGWQACHSDLDNLIRTTWQAYQRVFGL